jgi:CcmD family protein
MAEGTGGIGGLGMMVLAYGAIWVILLVFVVRAFARLSGLQREIADLRREIDERLPASGSGPS